jgi:exosome complex component RRP42
VKAVIGAFVLAPSAKTKNLFTTSFATMRLSPPELSFLYTSLTSDPPLRPDLRSLNQLRPLSIQTDVLPIANGSARVSWGSSSPGQGGEVLVVVKAQIEDATQASTDVNGGRVSINMFIPLSLG